MMRVKASLFCGFCYFGDLSTEQKDLALMGQGRCAKVRRQGYPFGDFNLRV